MSNVTTPRSALRVQPTPPPVVTPGATGPVMRVAAIDAYRGLVMFLMMAEVLHLRQISDAFPENETWRYLAWHQTHVEWWGATLHDMIQPSFSFLVGVSLPFSIASRRARGQGFWGMTLHAAWRALLLVALGVFLRSVGREQTNFTFEDTLSQIGLGYLPLFLLGWTKPRWQVLALVVILLGMFAAFALYPLPGSDFDLQAVGVSPEWAQQHNYTGFAAHFNKNSNVSWAFDRWFLNLFPRSEPFTHNGGGYATLSFIPTLGTMVLGLLAGNILLPARSGWKKLLAFFALAALCLGIGGALDHFNICPAVKRIWTPTWVLTSGGFCFLFLAGFYLVMDMMKLSVLGFPLRVIGANSIAAYLFAHLSEEFVKKSLQTHLGHDIFHRFGDAWAPLAAGGAVLLVFWLVLLWMYRQRIFVRI
jgi:predicted acyltransferase